LSRPLLIIAGQFPPPVNGFAHITREMTQMLAGQHRTVIVDLAPHVPKNGLFYHFLRLLLTLRGIGPLLAGRRNAQRRLYIACEGGLGLVYTLILAVAGRTLGYTIFVHHHSFAYIEKKKILMIWLLRMLNQGATHIFLCPEMASRFADRYRSPVSALILSNSAFIDPMPCVSRCWQPETPLTIGLLSNLSIQKGLAIFLSLLRHLQSAGLPIRGVLAGPPADDEARKAIDKAQEQLGNLLEYCGPLYNDAKHIFFHSIDIFIYPTLNDAQPAVIFEAMAQGVPVLAYDRGCIRGQVGACGAVAGQEEDFIAFAVRWLKEILHNPNRLHSLKCATQEAFLDNRAIAMHTRERLFECVPQVIESARGDGAWYD